MIIVENRTINDGTFTYTYSDEGFYIERDGVLYWDAYDPVDSGRTYTETDIPLPQPTDAEYAEAGKILMGVAE